MKNRIAIVISLAFMLVTMISNTVCAADQSLSFRNDAITLTAPEYYELYGNDSYPEYHDIGYRYCAETIFDSDYSTDGEFIYFCCQYVYFDLDAVSGSTKDEASSIEWFRDNRDCIEAYLDNERIVSLGEEDPEFIKSDVSDEGWIRVECEDYNTGDTYLYMSASENNDVFRFVFYQKWDSDDERKILSEKDLNESDRIIQSFNDVGDYGQEVIEAFDEAEYEQDSFDFADILIGVVLVGIALFRTAVDRKKKKSQDVTSKGKGTTSLGVEVPESFMDIELEEIGDADDDAGTGEIQIDYAGDEGIGDNQIELIIKEKEQGFADVIRSAIHSDKKSVRRSVDGDEMLRYECSYEESLKTMYRSGFMTKAEMDEMLRKHREREATGKRRRGRT